MASNQKLGFYITIFCLSVALVSWSAEDIRANELAVGEPFPVVHFPSLADRTPSSIVQFRGQKLVLHIWASW